MAWSERPRRALMRHVADWLFFAYLRPAAARHAGDVREQFQRGGSTSLWERCQPEQFPPPHPVSEGPHSPAKAAADIVDQWQVLGGTLRRELEGLVCWLIRMRPLSVSRRAKVRARGVSDHVYEM